MDKNLPDRETAFNTLFSALPNDPKARIATAIELQQAFRQRIIKELQPAVNQLLKNPPESFLDKQTLSSDLNQAFHQLGVAACEHSISQPCSIVAHRSQSVGDGWLKLQTKKPPQLRSKPTTKLEQIELIAAIRKESFGRNR